MKTTLLLTLLILSNFVFGQKDINVYLNRTTSLIFQQSIRHVACGTDQGIGYLTEDSIPRVLEIRINDFFPSIGSTNILVITEDEQVFAFEVQFQSKVTQTTYYIPDSLAICPKYTPIPVLQENRYKEENLYEPIISSDQFLTRILFSKKGKVKFQLNNIYTSDSLLFFHCVIANTSNLMYNIDFVHLFITDTKKMELKTQQDTHLPLIFLNKETNNIVPHSAMNIVFKTPKFTLENDKICILECFERKGGRHMNIRLNNKILLEASNLNNILKQ